MVAPIKKYETKLDNKNRLTVRGVKARRFAVQVFADGHILLSPQKLVPDPDISPKTLKSIMRSMENMKKGAVSKPIDIQTARKLFKK